MSPGRIIHFAGAVDALDLLFADEREKVPGLSDRFDSFPCDQHRTVFDALESGVHGDDVPVDQQLSFGHDFSPFRFGVAVLSTAGIGSEPSVDLPSIFG